MSLVLDVSRGGPIRSSCTCPVPVLKSRCKKILPRRVALDQGEAAAAFLQNIEGIAYDDVF